MGCKHLEGGGLTCTARGLQPPSRALAVLRCMQTDMEEAVLNVKSEYSTFVKMSEGHL